MAFSRDAWINSGKVNKSDWVSKEWEEKEKIRKQQEQIKPPAVVQDTSKQQYWMAPRKQTIGGKVANFFKATLPDAAENVWDKIKEPITGPSLKQTMTELKMSPKMLVEDSKEQMAKENPTWRDYRFIKPTQQAVKTYGLPTSSFKAINEDTTELQKQLNAAEKTWQVSPIDATASNTWAATTGIFGNLASMANSIGADKVPVLKEVTNFAVEGAKAAQQNAQQYNKGSYGRGLGTITQGVVNLVPYFVLGTGGAAVKGAEKVGKYAKYIEPIIKNPSFWYSLSSMWGQKYQEKIDEGYNRFEALGNAILYAVPSALVEVGGGIGASGKEGQSLLRTMGEEIGEEILQDLLSGTSDKVVTNHDLPWFSTTEDAVVNPKNLLETAAYTIPIVGIAGGANNIRANRINNKLNEQITNERISQEIQDYKLNSPYSKYLPNNMSQTVNNNLPLMNNNILPIQTATETVQNNVLPTQKVQETVQSAKFAGMTEINIKKATDLNNMIQSGAKLYFYDPDNLPQNIAKEEMAKAKIANGFYSNGTIYINKNSKNAVEQILGHELTHYLETTKSYNDLANAILDSEAFYTFLSEKGFNNIQEYKNSLKEYYSDEQLDSEMVARFVEEKLFTDQESINVLARQNSTLTQKIKAWIDDMVVKFTGTAQEKELRKIQNMYKKALEQAKNNSATNESMKYSFAGVNAKTKNVTKLKEAEVLESKGVSAEEIFEQTGWYRGNEGKWRFEIDDTDFNINQNVIKAYGTYKLEEILYAPALYEAYPEIKDLEVMFDKMPESGSFSMEWDGKATIYVSNDLIKNEADDLTQEMLGIKNQTDVLKTLMHEIQHYIQDKEGFSRGASVDYWYYKKNDKMREAGKKVDDLEKWRSMVWETLKKKVGYDEKVNELSEIEDAEKRADTLYEYRQSIYNSEDYKAIARIDQKIEDAKNEYYKWEEEVPSLLYKNTAGEQEARNVQERMRLSKEEKAKKLPFIKTDYTVYNEGDGEVYHISDNFGDEIDKALNSQLSSNTQVKARDYTPKILVDNGVKDLPMLITQKHIRSTIYSLQEAQQKGLPIKGTNYHGLGKELLMKAIDNLDNPKAIYKTNEDNYLVVTEFKDNNNREVVIPIKIDGRGRYNGVFIDENQIKSVYGRKNLDKYIKDNNFIEIYTKKEGLDFNEGIQYSNVAKPLYKSIPQNEDTVNTKYSLKTSNDTVKKNKSRYSIDNPVNIAKNPPNIETGLDEIKKRAKEKQGDSYSKFASSVQRSSIFSPEIKKLARDNININTYNRLANKDVLIEANDKLNEGGQSEVTRLLSKSEKAFTPQDVAESILLMDRYQQTGDYASAIEIMTKLRKAGTSGGQTIQMFSLLGRMTPEGMTFYAQKTLDDAYDEILKNKTQAWANENADKFKLTDKDIEYIQRRVNQASRLPEGRDKYVLLGEIAERIQDKIPPTSGQSLKSLARISMLLNPKTMVRNILGNLVIAPNHIISDFVGTGLDKAISKKTGVRTTGTLRGKDALKGMAKGAYESFDDFRRKISTREVGNDRFEIQDSGRSFNENHTGKLATQRNKLSKALNGLDRVTGFLLEAGDRPIYEGWFINSLNNQMELNKVTFPTAEMIEIATDEALQRTWQDNNTYTKVVSSVRNGLNKLNVKGYGLGDMVMPFVKTPANLTKAVVDFSPLGAINAAIKTSNFSKSIGKGDATSKQQREVVKAWSQVITGTLGMAIMTGLANAGALSGKGDEDKDVRAFEQNILGIKPYSIKIGDKSYTYDWAQPLGTTAAMVTDTAKSLKEAGNAENKVSAVLNGLQSGASVLLDQSFVSGIRNLFEEDNLINALIETAMNEPAKFTPQTLGQIAQIGDKKARTTYVYNDKLATGINKVKAKIPGLRQTLEPSVDVLGREVEVDNSVGNVMFNPANTAYARTTKAAEEMYSVYQATGDKAVIAQVAPYYFNNDGKKVVLTPKLKTQYQKTLGKISSDGVEKLLNNKAYNNLQSTDKAEILKALYSYAGAMAKKEADDTYSIPKDIQKIVDSKLSPEEYILLRYIANSSGSKKDEMYNGLIESGYSKKNTESFLTEYKGYKFNTNAKNTLPTYASKQSKLPTISLSKSKK